VVSLAFSPDGSQVVCNSEVGTVRLWDTRTYHQIAVPRDRTGDRSRHPGRSPPSAFSPTGAFFVCGSDGGEISVWETATCKKILVLDSIEEMWTVACSPDGNKIVSGSQNGMVRVWDSQTGARLAELEGHDGSVNSVSISPDGSQIASASNDQTIRIWDMRTTGVSVLRGHSDCVNSVAFSPDGRQIVSGSRDQTVRVWDVQSAMEIAVLEGHSIGVLSVAFSPEGAHIASSSADYTIRIWDVQRLPRTVGNDPETTRHIVLSLDGSRVVSTAGKHGRVWDVQSGTQIASLYGHTDKIMAVAFSPEPAGSKTVTSSLDETVRVWDTQSGQQLAVFSVNDNHVDIVALSPDSTRAVCVSNDGTIRVWDVSRSLALAVIPLGESSVSAVALSPDGLQVISSSWAGMTVWDIATGTKVAILGEFGKSRKDGPSAFSFEFSSDGERLYTSHHPAWFRHRSTVGQLPSSYLCQDLVWDFQDVVTPQHSPSPRKVTPITATTTSRASSGRTEGPSQDVILLTWDLMTGWLSCVSNPETEDPTHLCWLPVDRRGDVVVLRGWEAFLGGAGGTLTILDCTDAINRLVGLGIV
jgi:WD40 repeat protein